MSDLAKASTLTEALAAVRAATRADRPFLTWPKEGGGTGAMTRGEAAARIDAWGLQFAAWGLKPGDRVMIASHDDGAVVASVLACFTWGLSAVVFDPGGTASEAGPLAALTSPAATIIDATLLASWKLPRPASCVALECGLAPGQAVAPAASWASRLLRKPPAAPQAAAVAPPAALDDAGEAYVLFTSGSTSRPKGVCISRGALLAHAKTLARQLRHDAGSRIFDPLHLYHADGLIQGPVLAWLAGGACLRPMRFEVSTVEAFCAAIYRERATHLVAVPTILSILLEQAAGLEDTFGASDFRGVISTGGALPDRLWAGFEERFRVRIANVYGLTETVVGGCFSGPDDASHRVGTVGKPVDCEARVEGGELQVRGPHLMTGYLSDPEATAAVLRDGWLRTGDLAAIDADGFVRITGRSKSVVISAGQNIQPEEVDDVLRAVPGVRDAATFGLPDPRFGEILVGCVEGSGVSEAALIEACRAKLSGYKVPRSLALVEALPRGAAGKVAIPEARRLFEDSRRAAAASGSGDAARRVVEIASAVFHVPAAALSPASTPANTAGWDSFGHLAFVEALEAAFGLRLGTREIMAIRSLGDAIALALRGKSR